ncbi:MAG: aminotransferase class V-fold PLP-dependent enzyme [Alphaproteobacteria bacterium]|nr:aminotransferase class V-fold PLP-dependent enzyme [Alphaproteobacteria bacterium]
MKLTSDERKRNMGLWSRTRLDVSWRDLLAGALACAGTLKREPLIEQAEFYWPGHKSLIGFSVRSGFDLLLQALDLKPGDEVLFSALNVKGMINIARRAELVPVPLDFDHSNVTPDMATLKRAISPRSKILVIAHLFGCRLALDPLIKAAHEAGLIVVEDCAQAFNGTDYPGHPEADVSMFSFGPLKTATALGGALINVRDSALRKKMHGIQDLYPVQPNGKQLNRIVKFAGLKLLTMPLIFGLIQRGFAVTGRDYEDAVADSVRNVAVLKSAKNLRLKPSNALLSLLCRRLKMFDSSTLERRAQAGRDLAELLGDDAVLPGQANEHHDYWVFPILVDEPARFIAHLRARGFDASDLPRSQAVAAPDDRPELEPLRAAELLSKLIILPCYEQLPAPEMRRLAASFHTAMQTQAIGSSPMHGTAGGKTLQRWWTWEGLRAKRRRFVKKSGKRLIRRLSDFLASQSLVSNAPVIDQKQFPFLKEIQDQWQDIHSEMLQVLKHKEHIPAFEEISSDQKRIAQNRQWRTFILYGFGTRSDANCEHAPVTAGLLERVPNIQTALFSILEPGYRIPAHRGVTKGILRCHVGLIVPEDRGNCWMRVDQEKCHWGSGELLVFDDTYEHEVRNDTSQERVVLLFDFERPMRLAGRLVNRLFIRLLKLTAYYQEPKKNLKSFEERFDSATRRMEKHL